MTDTPCTRCGQVHSKCSAHSKRSGGPCGKAPMKGQTVCASHGGKAPQNLAAADTRTREQAAQRALATFGLPRAVDPHAALLEELHRTAGVVAWLGALVAELDEDEVVWGMTRDKEGGEDRGTTYEAGSNTWVKLWQHERAHLAKVARDCLTSGIEERRVRVAEDSGRLLAGVVRAILERLNLTDEQRQLVPVVVPEELRRVAELGGGGRE